MACMQETFVLVAVVVTVKLFVTNIDHGIKTHHHHRDAKRLAGASRRCDRSPERSVLR